MEPVKHPPVARISGSKLVGVFFLLAVARMGFAAPPDPALSRQPALTPGGRLVDVGGRKLHLICTGKREPAALPAVVLLAGAGEFSIDWALTQPGIAKQTKVCAVDRAGYAWSDNSAGFEKFDAASSDLTALLQKASVPPPYILVGHAFGALYARDYQRRYPQNVAGLVLVDPTPEEDTQVRMFGNTVALLDMADHDLKAWPVRPFAPSLTSPPPVPGATDPAFARLPPKLQAARSWARQKFFVELAHLSADEALAVMESQRQTFTDLYNARHDPGRSPLSVPVIVLSRGRQTTPQIQSMQQEQARLSRNTKHVLASESGPWIHLEQPDLVISAVAEMLQAIRAGRLPGAIR